MGQNQDFWQNMSFNPLPHEGIFLPQTTATGNDRPSEKTIIEGNPYPPPWCGVQNVYEVVCVSEEGPLVHNPPS